MAPGTEPEDRQKSKSGWRNMKKTIGIALAVCALLGTLPAFSQVKMTRDQMLFYTSEWKGDRFPDGRPKVPDSLLKRAVDMTIEDVWEYLRNHGYRNQFESGWQALPDVRSRHNTCRPGRIWPRPLLPKARRKEG